MATESLRKIKTLMNAEDLAKVLQDVARQIHENEPEDLVIVGIQTRGVPLAERLRRQLAQLRGNSIPGGSLDITFYRDDLTRIHRVPVVKGSQLDVPIEDRTVILVDDVLYTGRTVRAAMDELLDYGRPRAIRLFVLVDRGLRELPICADYTGLKIHTTPTQVVEARIREVDGQDEVLLMEKLKAGEV